jgi:hypothetical protein
MPAPDGAVRGKILERIDAASYSYLRIAAQGGEVWAAIPRSELKVGETVVIDDPVWMQDFEGKAIGRKFARIAFGTVAGAPAGKTQPAAADPVPSLTGPSGAAFVHPARAPAADVGSVRVDRAPGPTGRTVAQVFAQRAALSGKPVAIRGKVVKFTPGVLGRNWVHLRDGSGSQGSDDLLVTTQDDCAVGDVVLAKGTARIDQDFGAGYSYPVLIEGATLTAR